MRVGKNSSLIRVVRRLGLTLVMWLGGLGFVQAEFSVVTSFYPVYVATLNVVDGAPGVTVQNLSSPAVGCLHDYQLTPADMRTLTKADVFVVNGGGMESYLDKVVRRLPRLKVVDASEGIALANGNAHVWVSPAGAIGQVRNIARGLAEADPGRAGHYAAGAEAYIARLEELEAGMKASLAPYGGRRIIVFHEGLAYLGRDFGMEVARVVERDPGTEPSARELAETIDLVRRLGVTALFTEPQYPSRSAATIARETGVAVYQLDPVVTGSRDPREARMAYLRAMERNREILLQALQ